MTVRTMVDAIRPIVPPPHGATVFAFYLPGNGATHGFSAAEVNAVRPRYAGLLPIQVAYNDFSNPVADAERALAQLAGLGITDGAVALDIEGKVAARATAANYPRRWAARIRAASRYSLGYTSRSTASAVAGCDGRWIAGYDSREQLEGYEAHQWADPGPWDLSLIDDALVPLWGLGASQPPTPPAPPIAPDVQPAHIFLEEHMKRIPLRVTLDDQGNGYADLPGVDDLNVIGVKVNAADPARNGYPAQGIDVSTCAVDGVSRVVVVDAAARGAVDVAVWVATD